MIRLVTQGKANIMNDYTVMTVSGIDAKELHLLHVRLVFAMEARE
jgi:hypothetical protein